MKTVKIEALISRKAAKDAENTTSLLAVIARSNGDEAIFQFPYD